MLVAHDHFGRSGGALLGSVPRALGLSLAALWTPGLPGFRGAKADPGRWPDLADLVAKGAVRPRIGEVLDLAEIRQAMACMLEGKSPGRVVLRVS